MHAAEVRNDPETEAILRFGPDRIGHGTFIRANPNLLSLLKEKRIPLGVAILSLDYVPRQRRVVQSGTNIP